jgi:hypothetical protein
LNDKQRGPYEAKAAADKKRYEDEKAAYNVRSLPFPFSYIPPWYTYIVLHDMTLIQDYSRPKTMRRSPPE